MKRPKLSARVWRAADRHSGIGKASGIPYTYEHVGAPPRASADVYRVECYVPFTKPTPLHRNVYYVPARRLAEFVEGFHDVGEMIVDIQPVTLSQAEGELHQFRESRGGE